MLMTFRFSMLTGMTIPLSILQEQLIQLVAYGMLKQGNAYSEDIHIKGVLDPSNHARRILVMSIIGQLNSVDLFVSGGRDGQLLVWDTRTTDAPSDANSDDNYVPLINGHLVDKGKEELESFTGVSFYNDDQTILSTQSNSTMIKVWDLRLMSQATPKKKKSDKTTNPYLMLRIDKSLALQNRITYITDKIINFREKVTKKKEDLVELWYS